MARTRRHDGPHEVGSPTYAPTTLRQLEGQHRAQLRRKGDVRTWRIFAALYLVLGVGLVAGAAVETGRKGAVAAVVVAGVALGMTWARRPWVDRRPEVLTAWELWARSNADMVTALRSGLGPEWVVLWERRVPDWRDPVTWAVGPGGLWALWVAPPDQPSAKVTHDQVAPLLLDVVADEPALITRVADVPTPPTWWEQVTAAMVVTPLVLSAGDVRRLAGRIDTETLAETEALPDA
jgi:hypothetical protein